MAVSWRVRPDLPAVNEMLLIRQVQLDSMAVDRPGSFSERLLRHVADHFTESATLSGENGQQRKVEWCIAFARQHGVCSEIGIALCTDACFALGDKDPLTIPGVEATFADDELDGDTKARKFCDRVMLYLDELTEPTDSTRGDDDAWT